MTLIQTMHSGKNLFHIFSFVICPENVFICCYKDCSMFHSCICRENVWIYHCYLSTVIHVNYAFCRMRKLWRRRHGLQHKGGRSRWSTFSFFAWVKREVFIISYSVGDLSSNEEFWRAKLFLHQHSLIRIQRF